MASRITGQTVDEPWETIAHVETRVRLPRRLHSSTVQGLRALTQLPPDTPIRIRTASGEDVPITALRLELVAPPPWAPTTEPVLGLVLHTTPPPPLANADFDEPDADPAPGEPR